MRVAEYSARFERDLRLAEKRGKDIAKLKRLIALLVDGQPLPRRYGDHPLKGNWVGYRDAHIEPDWVLIYKLAGDTVRFQRTGTHSDIFDE
jgi:mRNA interferase YafQ